MIFQVLIEVVVARGGGLYVYIMKYCNTVDIMSEYVKIEGGKRPGSSRIYPTYLFNESESSDSFLRHYTELLS